MSNTTVLERPATQVRPSLKDQFISPAEEAHANRIADNFRRLRFDNVQDYNSARDGDPVSDNVAVLEPETAEPSVAAARIAQYSPVETPVGKPDLFEGYVFKDGKLETPVQVAAAPAPARSVAEARVMTATPAPVAAEEDDAVPTRRTMDTLRRPAAKMEEGEAVAEEVARPALSTRMKVALIAVVATIILAIALICINSGIIRSIDEDILRKQSQLDELTRSTQSVQDQIADLTTPDSIAEWAAKNNMVRG